jgi:hypothetical protein
MSNSKDKNVVDPIRDKMQMQFFAIPTANLLLIAHLFPDMDMSKTVGLVNLCWAFSALITMAILGIVPTTAEKMAIIKMIVDANGLQRSPEDIYDLVDVSKVLGAVGLYSTRDRGGLTLCGMAHHHVGVYIVSNGDAHVGHFDVVVNHNSPLMPRATSIMVSIGAIGPGIVITAEQLHELPIMDSCERALQMESDALFARSLVQEDQGIAQQVVREEAAREAAASAARARDEAAALQMESDALLARSLDQADAREAAAAAALQMESDALLARSLDQADAREAAAARARDEAAARARDEAAALQMESDAATALELAAQEAAAALQMESDALLARSLAQAAAAAALQMESDALLARSLAQADAREAAAAAARANVRHFQH